MFAERDDREGGGSAVVIHPSIKSWPRKDLDVEGVEGVWCEVSLCNKRIVIASIYVRPDDEATLKKVIDHLATLEDTHENIIVTGDLNARHQMWFNENSNKLGDLFAPFLLSSQLIMMNNYDRTYKKSVIDLTLVKGCQQNITDWKASPDIFINSDHNCSSLS